MTICDSPSLLATSPRSRFSVHTSMQHAGLRRSAVALSTARRVREYTRRTLATATETNSLDFDFPPPDFDSKSSDSPNVSAQTNAVFIRPWEGISSMPELLAIVRGLERHYGRIREYGVARVSDPSIFHASGLTLLFVTKDFDVNFQYLPYFWVNFEDPASFARVPEAPSLLKLDVPRIDLARPGGIGLEDLQGLLQPDDYVSPDAVFDEAQSQTAAKSTKGRQTVTVDIRVERASAWPLLLGVFGGWLTCCRDSLPAAGPEAAAAHQPELFGRVLRLGRVLPTPYA